MPILPQSVAEETPNELKVNATKFQDKGHYIIGIGASAGGLEAINRLFDHLPGNLGASYVIIQHLSPNHKSLMSELLTKHTSMEIQEGEDGMLIKQNAVYLIPNNKIMTIKRGRLRLADKIQDSTPNTAIDIFFQSLAKDKEVCAIGIILSGTGTDGTKGIEAIKKHGGMVIVQDPGTAKFDGMPNSAIASGCADFVLAPEQMFKGIVDYTHYNTLAQAFMVDDKDSKDSVYAEILQLIKANTSFDFTSYKLPTISRRILKRMAENGIDTLERYVELLKESPDELKILSKEFLIGVTRFFRDQEAFDMLKQEVIPAIVDSKKHGDTIKVWVPGCSTGEEAFSIAILFKEYIDQLRKEVTVKIFATDIDQLAVQTAAKGQYTELITKDISEERLRRYFYKKGDKYCVQEPIRKMVIFAQHDIIKNPPFSKVDLVSCRNMLIYMNTYLQKKVFHTFHFSLNVEGFLFLGSSENPGTIRKYLEDVNKKWKIYKVIEAPKNGLVPTMEKKEEAPQQSKEKIFQAHRFIKKDLHSRSNDIFVDAIIENFGFAAIYVNENFELIQASGNYKKYLSLPERKLQFNIFKMVPEELSITLGAALRKAVKNNDNLNISNVRIHNGAETRYINVSIKPYLDKQEYDEKFIFLLFSESNQSLDNRSAENFNYQHYNDNERVLNLEQELKETKESLYAAFEELEVSNEELQSNNEELLSSNEELQSTNEELQSLNEELHTVNAEHQQKIKELLELNEDVDNYFKSTDIGQVFIDQELTIRKFTPAATKQINLIEGDIGRPISHISSNIKYDNLVSDIQQVIATNIIIEKEIELKDGKYFQMKILPYVKLNKKTDGVVVTFVEITTIKRLNNIVSSVLNSSLNGIMALQAVKNENKKIIDFEWVLVNNAAGKLFKRRPNDLIGKKLLQEMPGNKKSRLFEKYVKVVETGEPLNVEVLYDFEGINTWFQLSAVKLENGLVVTFTDINDKKSAEDKLLSTYEEVKLAEENLRKFNSELEQRVEERTKDLSLSEERFRLISKATNDAIWDWTFINNDFWWNESFKSLFLYRQEEIEPGVAFWFSRIHPEDRDRVIASVNEAINHQSSQWADEYRFLKADGSYAYVFNRGYIMHNENNMPYRMLGSLIDMTKLKSAQKELESTNVNLTKINNDLDNFIYTASHDLKAPITNIEGLIMNLQKVLNSEDTHIKTVFEHMTKSIDRFKLTIKDLTEISKIQKDIDNESAKVKFKEVLDDVLLGIGDMIDSNNAQVISDFRVYPEITYSRKNLNSILYNFISNAIKYRAADREPVVRLSTYRKDEELVLEVSDNGLGLKDGQKDKLFTMFKRLHTHVEGSGVGLYIVKRIIDNNEGRIEVESTLNEGTTFKVYFSKQFN